jgi:hypothetical protein
MRFQVEIPNHLVDCLRDLANESYRSPQKQAAYLLAVGIERALQERESTRERHLEEVAYGETEG